MTTSEQSTDAHIEIQKIPDGIGLSMDALQAILIKEHKSSVPDDDPLLMVGTLLNSFLGEYDKMLKQHNAALTAYYEDQTKMIIAAAQQTAEAASGIGIIQEVCQKHLEAVNIYQNNMKWLAAIVAIAALLNVAAFVLGGLR